MIDTIDRHSPRNINKIGNHNRLINKRRTIHDHRFSSYLSFNLSSTICIFIFLITYIIILLIFSPLLQQDSPIETEIQRGKVLQPVFDQMKKLTSDKDIVTNLLKKQLIKFRNDVGITDQSLMEQAKNKINELRKTREDKAALIQRLNNKINNNVKEQSLIIPNINNVFNNVKKRNGFIVLGMHRSGTSMLSGLLTIGYNYNVGGPLIGGKPDNIKGFFELLDVVLQNDAFMEIQNVWWSANVINYKAEVSIQDMKEENKLSFTNGEKALNFLNNANNIPYLLKDPRLCITLKTWLHLLNHEPAILFTYRHPLEVANSLKKRERNFSLDHGLRLWIVYNMRAIQNSYNLCVVYSSNESIFNNPYNELQRITNELTTKCGVPKPSEQLTQDIVDRFVDPNLLHNNQKQKEREMLNNNENDYYDNDKMVIANYDGCIVYQLETTSLVGSVIYNREEDLYMKAMKMYCDFKNGKAYKDDYEWPELA